MTTNTQKLLFPNAIRYLIAVGNNKNGLHVVNVFQQWGKKCRKWIPKDSL